ncbi:MAG TPA: Fur family transcriptional regulator [Roseiarcus sp.]
MGFEGHETGGAAWAAEVENACASKGLQLTALRRRVMTILGQSDSPLGAYAIIDEMRRLEGKPVAPPTVYRTLEFFLENGFVHKIETRNAYAPCAHFGHAHQGVLLLCEKCGRSEEIDEPGLARAIEQAAHHAGFVTHRQMVEIQGLCPACARAA